MAATQKQVLALCKIEGRNCLQICIKYILVSLSPELVGVQVTCRGTSGGEESEEEWEEGERSSKGLVKDGTFLLIRRAELSPLIMLLAVKFRNILKGTSRNDLPILCY